MSLTPLYLPPKLQRQTVFLTAAAIAREDEIGSDKGLCRTANQDEYEAIERDYEPETSMAIASYRDMHAASIDEEGNPKTQKIRLLFPIDPSDKSQRLVSGHNQFWNGDTLMSTEPPEQLHTLQGRPAIDAENIPAKSENFELEVDVSNRTEMQWYIPVQGGEQQVYKQRASKSPVKPNASMVTSRLSRYGG